MGAVAGAWRSFTALVSYSHAATATYASQNETPFLRSIRRATKIRMRLGAGFSFAEPFPEKPPGMHRRTYLRMRVAAGESIALHDQP